MELLPYQIFVVGLVATGLAAVLRLLVAKFGNFEISKFWMTIIVAAVSMVLAVVFNLPAFPVYVEPFQYLGEWLAIASVYVDSATIIYNLILDKVLDKVGLDAKVIAEG